MANDYASMAQLARSLLEAGKSNDEILRACYGVPFPAETLVLAEMMRDDAEPAGSFLTRPWALLTPLTGAVLVRRRDSGTSTSSASRSSILR